MAKIVITKRTLTPENSKKLTKSRIKFSIILRSIAAACVIASVYDIVRVSYRELRPYTTKFIEKFLRENNTHFSKIKQLAENLTKNHHFETFVSTTASVSRIQNLSQNLVQNSFGVTNDQMREFLVNKGKRGSVPIDISVDSSSRTTEDKKSTFLAVPEYSENDFNLTDSSPRNLSHPNSIFLTQMPQDSTFFVAPNSLNAPNLTLSSTKFTQKLPEKSNNTFVLVLGSGRCGLLSFARFLNQQENSFVTFERGKCKNMEWNRDNFSASDKRYEFFQQKIKTDNLVLSGDVASWWLPYSSHILKNYPNSKIIALKRDKNDTLNSYEKWYGKRRNFPWLSSKDRSLTDFYDNYDYDECFPEYKVPGVRYPSLRYAGRLFYEEYYEKVDRLIEHFGRGRVRMFDTYDALNNEMIRHEILQWLDLPQPFHLRKPVTNTTHQTMTLGQLTSIINRYQGQR